MILIATKAEYGNAEMGAALYPLVRMSTGALLHFAEKQEVPDLVTASTPAWKAALYFFVLTGYGVYMSCFMLTELVEPQSSPWFLMLQIVPTAYTLTAALTEGTLSLVQAIGALDAEFARLQQQQGDEGSMVVDEGGSSRLTNSPWSGEAGPSSGADDKDDQPPPPSKRRPTKSPMRRSPRLAAARSLEPYLTPSVLRARSHSPRSDAKSRPRGGTVYI